MSPSNGDPSPRSQRRRQREREREERERLRREREMARRLAALDRHDERLRAAGRDPFDEWLQDRSATPRGPRTPLAGPSSQARGRRHPHRYRGFRSVMIVVIVIAVSVGAIWAIGALGDSGTAARGPAANAQFPPAPSNPATTPGRQPAPAPSGPDIYTFMNTEPGSGEPVTWNPCRPIHYATNGIAPEKGQEILAAAFARLSHVTGFTFINDGPTTEPPDLQRAPYQPGRYPDRWAPVLVAWTTPAVIGDLSGDVIGLGGAIPITGSEGRRTYVSGMLYLDRPQITRELSATADTATADTGTADTAGAAVSSEGPSRATQIRALILHELGHLTGLGHVGDPHQLMFPTMNHQVTDFGVGDLRGLHRLATGPCGYPKH